MQPATLIVGASPAPGGEAFYRALLASAEHVIACDAAGEWCVALGRRPDLVVGDFDSAAPGAVQRLAEAGVATLLYPAAKDESDFDLALDAARRTGAREVVLTAAFTRRLDHTLTALGTLLRAVDLSPRIEEPGYCARLVDPAHDCPVVLEVVPGATVSVIALAEASGVCLSGFEYPLDNARMPLLSSLGVSNVTRESRVTVSTERGTLLVIASRDAGSSSSD